MNNKKFTLLIVPYSERSGRENMEIDRSFYEKVCSKKNLVVIRFYKFNPSAITLGCYQKERTINRKLIEDEGIDIVRRLTGGRAVLHMNDLTYLIAAGVDTPFFEGGLRGSMERISSIFIEVFSKFGMKLTSESGRKLGRSNMGACFDAPSLFELKYNGFKIMGSAQKRCNNGFFQHGSIPCKYNDELNIKLLNAPTFKHAESALFLSDEEKSEEFQKMIIETIIRRFSPSNIDYMYI